MLTMENTNKTNKKFRNPFPAVGKVFKYEMISGARTILPLYAVLLVLSLIIGVFAINNNLELDQTEGFVNAVKVIIVVLDSILSVVTFVIVLCIIERRFKKSMLGDEAYLNLTLPVSVGEHLWGRYLADLVWAASYGVTMLLSVLLIFIRIWNEITMEGFFGDIAKILTDWQMEHGYSLPAVITMLILNALVFFMLICVFSYMTESIIQIIGKHKTLFSILIFAVIFFLFTNLLQVFVTNFIDNHGFFKVSYLWSPLLYNLAWTVLFSIVTRLILTFKLNLE